MPNSYCSSEDPDQDHSSQERKPRHFRAILATGEYNGNAITPREVFGLVEDGVLNTSEAMALIRIYDEIDGWRKRKGGPRQRWWVRMTRSDWAQMLGMTEKAANDVRDSLLRKGYIRRRKASEAPEAVQGQNRSGYQYTYVDVVNEEKREAIARAANPDAGESSDEGESVSESSSEESEAVPGGDAIPSKPGEVDASSGKGSASATEADLRKSLEEENPFLPQNHSGKDGPF